MAKAKIALRWKGNGFYVKVPARDLTAEEVERYGEAFLLALGLYEKVKQPKPKAAKKEKPLADEWKEEDELWQG